jgi:hypothetical protein
MTKRMSARYNTNKVLELMEEGNVDWEVWARETLCYLSESQVTEIAHTLDLFEDEEVEDEEEDEDY